MGETSNFCRLNVSVAKQPPPIAPKPSTPISPPLIFYHSKPPTFISDPLTNLVLKEGEKAIFEVIYQ